MSFVEKKRKEAAKKPAGKAAGKAAAKKAVLPGTVRIRADDLRAYEKTKSGWKLSKKEFTEATHLVELFRAHGSEGVLVDKKDPQFLKGQLSPDGKCQGARVDVLPDGRKLDKAYSILADHLMVHDEASNEHWDVIYRNPNGKYAYVYTMEKERKHVKEKYREVEKFEKLYPQLLKMVTKALSDEGDEMAVPMYTLLRTCMRVGNEIYYKAHGHKGLTTLKKDDIMVKENTVTFVYLSKGGIPQVVREEFPQEYVKRLSMMLAPLKPEDFVFANRETGHPLNDMHFKKAFEHYCGHPFYPHIVRSFYATEKAKEFLSAHKKGSLKRKELLEFYRFLASRLGHKRFAKKEKEWKDSYTVTIHHYIDPEVLGRLDALVGKRS
jgi:DNA topoisomerase IB